MSNNEKNREFLRELKKEDIIKIDCNFKGEEHSFILRITSIGIDEKDYFVGGDVISSSYLGLSTGQNIRWGFNFEEGYEIDGTTRDDYNTILTKLSYDNNKD